MIHWIIVWVLCSVSFALGRCVRVRFHELNRPYYDDEDPPIGI